MKKALSLCLLLLVAFSLSAQPSGERKTVLFLIPFYSQDYNGNAVANVQSSQDIHTVNSFLLMGFWAGAQIALEEYDNMNVPLNVIVKDVTENEAQLRSIMENESLMHKVDLIIGPFFSKTFMIAAEYAKQYQIPIVNPFTNRTDILEGNEFVYKVIPSLEAKPASLSFVAEQYPDHKIILYRDTTIKNREQMVYLDYFKSHQIPYKEVFNQSALLNEIVPGKKNIILIYSHNAAKMLMVSRDLLYKSNPEDLLLVVPETWMQSKTYDVEYYSKLNLHFFSNFYVDERDQQTQVFIDKYKKHFKTIPTLEDFSFQGYDITRFFVEMILNNGDIDRVKVDALAYPMSFDKTPNGGYENVNVQFLEIKDDAVVPVTY